LRVGRATKKRRESTVMPTLKGVRKDLCLPLEWGEKGFEWLGRDWFWKRKTKPNTNGLHIIDWKVGLLILEFVREAEENGTISEKKVQENGVNANDQMKAGGRGVLVQGYQV